MCSMTVTKVAMLLTFVVRAHANDPSVDHIGSVQDKFFDRVLRASHVRRTDVDQTVLGKASRPGVGASLRSPQLSPEALHSNQLRTVVLDGPRILVNPGRTIPPKPMWQVYPMEYTQPDGTKVLKFIDGSETHILADGGERHINPIGGSIAELAHTAPSIPF
eukprot:gnl/TRDRNA2_/TRDRNA2_197834_c0_seq1.p1 gnl/TRDRNA2_/TRDRNA2_197834_c0~~gnl/TRDRNA2_/TRDRNA2_197834_c0_seq1.p1  ORF type:complete len:162 (-),score=16.91 gnl/TRDRNA2_/TRDRNA2_197834_c0_seq1:236-721(-)